MATWERVLGLFGIGGLTRSPQPVTGGWSHNVWRVSTAGGEFAIKEMVHNPQPWWTEQITAAINFELRAWGNGGIPMAEPISDAAGDYLPFVATDGWTQRYRCHRWVAGRPCVDEPPSVERSRQVGATVAKLVNLDVPGGSTRTDLAWNALEAYEATVTEAKARRLDWAPLLADLRSGVDQLRAQFDELADRDLPMLFLHRDLDPRNTARGADGELVVFDWDYAGPRLVASELLTAALSFAGGAADGDDQCVVATFDSYLATAAPVDFRGAAPPLAEEAFRWMMLNAWRALGHRGASPEQAEFAGSLVRSLASTWLDLRASLERWEAALTAG
ncbi:MAG: hypothetical protein QOI20_470 [Acidimicrobiaceae bacterium]|jgi:Ser/Thr protein kinase RdoA (MazF antagonist)|nr:hypothetical protein [Acidimicrobiaceae bacterium]